ncbi:MAG: hypothetical protein NVS3B26_25030 [Mycobacteriales bacterium]
MFQSMRDSRGNPNLRSRALVLVVVIFLAGPAFAALLLRAAAAVLGRAL